MPSAAVVCMALALYHEGRGEDWVGQVAIGQVIMNRVYDKRWPNDVCSVVKQGARHGKRRLYSCQFSFFCDGISERVRNILAWEKAIFLSTRVVDGRLTVPSLQRATCYYSSIYRKNQAPYWAHKSIYLNQIGNHRFYVCK
jgi:spore germination cell wall hydrolase CwlJ-like protein